jgi:hypothetical protein
MLDRVVPISSFDPEFLQTLAAKKETGSPKQVSLLKKLHPLCSRWSDEQLAYAHDFIVSRLETVMTEFRPVLKSEDGSDIPPVIMLSVGGKDVAIPFVDMGKAIRARSALSGPDTKTIALAREQSRHGRSSRVSIHALEYDGPIIPPGTELALTPYEIVINDTGDLGSTAGGVLLTVYSSNPSGSPNWTGSTDLFSRYRVLAWEVLYIPDNRYNRLTVTTRSVFVAIDRRNATAFTSNDDALELEPEMLSMDSPWKVAIRMDTIQEATFQAVSSPTAFSWVKMYSTGHSISTVYGMVYLRWLLQFMAVE